MSDTSANTTAPVEGKKTPNCKICCACPAERRLRDECTIFKGFDQCEAEISNFYKCLLSEGFSEADVESLKKNVRR